MFDKTKYLLEGCARPTDPELTAFYERAKSHCQKAGLPDDFQVRWIGGDAGSTNSILEHIRNGDKTGTVTVPEAIAHSGQKPPAVGDTIVLINFDGTPALVVRITAIEVVAYGAIEARHTGLDGPRVRDIPVWKPLHEGYFDKLLAPLGIRCTDATPISFETFELLCSAEELAND